MEYLCKLKIKSEIYNWRYISTDNRGGFAINIVEFAGTMFLDVCHSRLILSSQTGS